MDGSQHDDHYREPHLFLILAQKVVGGCSDDLLVYPLDLPLGVGDDLGETVEGEVLFEFLVLLREIAELVQSLGESGSKGYLDPVVIGEDECKGVEKVGDEVVLVWVEPL